MDPISALSVAAAAVQFADYSRTVVKTIINIYRSIESGGSVSQFQQLKSNAERLRTLNLRLKRSLDLEVLKRQPTETEDDLLAVTNECIEIASELLETLDQFDFEKGRSKIEAIRTAIKAVWNKGRLESLNQRLTEQQQQLMSVVLLSLREEINKTAQGLVSVGSASESSWNRSPNVGEEILEQLKEITRWQANLDDAFKQLRHDRIIERSLLGKDGENRNDDGKDSNNRCEVFWPITHLSTTLKDRLLASLEFPAMTTREKRIADAHAKTFEWIFKESKNSKITWSSFADWLKFGSGLYWITGKAGSGKSTLMKFIVHHKKTSAMLRSWAHDADLTVASFYFWHAGNQMQTSQEGLLQTLLHQAISQCSSISSANLAGRWESFTLSRDFTKSWTWPELEKAFKFLLEEQDPSLKFCFFIDGLDEFKGDLEALITLTKRISLYGNTKICVSSRPLIIFEDAFRTKPQLMLQDLTHADIRKYVEHNLTDNPGFTELRGMDEKYADGLMNNVAEKSDGVFLWVVLVVRSLLEGLRDGDHLLDLQKRLDDLPEELDDLFRRILHDFDTRYFRDASILFQLFKAWDGRLSLFSLALAEQAGEDLAIQAKMRPMSSSEKFYKALKMRRRLDSRCKGLLEVEPIRRKISETEERIVRDLSELKPEDGERLANSRVDFLHRTVSDFLDRPDIWAKFTAATENNFKPYAAFAQSWLLQLKWVYSDYAIAHASPLWNAIFGILEYAEKSESQEMLSQPRLLDELDESATFLIPQRRGSDGLTIFHASLYEDEIFYIDDFHLVNAVELP